MKSLDKILHVIDVVNIWAGKAVSYLLLLMMCIITFEVVMRYVFNAPTLWAMELNQLLFLILIALGGGYVLQHRGHINVDIFYNRAGIKGRAVLDLITFPLFFIVIAVLIWQTIIILTNPLQLKETTEMADIPVYPFRVILVAGVCLVAFQGLAKFFRDLNTVITKRGRSRINRLEKDGEDWTTS